MSQLCCDACKVISPGLERAGYQNVTYIIPFFCILITSVVARTELWTCRKADSITVSFNHPSIQWNYTCFLCIYVYICIITWMMMWHRASKPSLWPYLSSHILCATAVCLKLSVASPCLTPSLAGHIAPHFVQRCISAIIEWHPLASRDCNSNEASR